MNRLIRCCDNSESEINYMFGTEYERKYVKKALKWSEHKRETGIIRTTQFLYECLLKERLVFYTIKEGVTVSVEYKEREFEIASQLDFLITHLNELYGDQWDFYLNFDSATNKFILQCVIRYKEIEISNSKDQKHTIKDLFVFVDIAITTDYQLHFRDIKGGRTTLSYPEWCSGYRHSHLNTDRFPIGEISFLYLTNFCLGAGTDLDSISSLYYTSLEYQFTSEYIYSFFFALDDAVSWESVEGGPYIFISSISTDITKIDSSSVVYNLNSFRYNSFNDLDIENIDLQDWGVTFTFNNNSISINVDENYRNKVKEWLFIHRPEVIVRNDTTNMSLLRGYSIWSSGLRSAEEINNSFTNSKGERLYLRFREEKVCMQIEDVPENTEEDIKKKFFVHPNYLKDFTNYLNRKINENITRIVAFRKQTNNIR